MGTKFLIALGIGAIAYLIAGSVAAYQQNPENFLENFPPNKDFWKELIGLVSEGCNFTKQQVTDTVVKTARKVFKRTDYEDLTN